MIKIERSLLLVDGIGAAIWIAILCVIGGFTLGKPETASATVYTLATQVEQMRSDMGRMQSVLDARTRQHRQLVTQTSKQGKLPQRSPIEKGLGTFTTLGNATNVNLISIEPVSTVLYPGVLEERFQISAEGTFEDYLQFLQAFERCHIWADLTYLEVGKGTEALTSTQSRRRSEMTLSFYSALSPDEETSH